MAPGWALPKTWPPRSGDSPEGNTHWQRHEASRLVLLQTVFWGPETVHIKVKKNFLSKNLPVFTYADKGVLLEDQPFVQDDCYYRGYVEGDPESLVSLNNCFGGFQGMLQTNDIVYEIEPKRFSTAFEHLIYKLDDEETKFSYNRCGLTDEEIAGQLKFQETINPTLMQSAYTGWWTHKYFLEVGVVVDHSRYLYHKSNDMLVQKEVFLVLNGVSDLMKALDLRYFSREWRYGLKKALLQ